MITNQTRYLSVNSNNSNTNKTDSRENIIILIEKNSGRNNTIAIETNVRNGGAEEIKNNINYTVKNEGTKEPKNNAKISSKV